MGQKQAKSLIKKSVNSIQQISPETFAQIAINAGLTPETLVDYLKELINHKSIKIDKNGEVHENLDGKLRLAAIESICKLTGWTKPPTTTESKFKWLEKIGEDKFAELSKKVRTS